MYGLRLVLGWNQVTVDSPWAILFSHGLDPGLVRVFLLRFVIMCLHQSESSCVWFNVAHVYCKTVHLASIFVGFPTEVCWALYHRWTARRFNNTGNYRRLRVISSSGCGALIIDSDSSLDWWWQFCSLCLNEPGMIHLLCSECTPFPSPPLCRTPPRSASLSNSTWASTWTRRSFPPWKRRRWGESGRNVPDLAPSTG